MRVLFLSYLILILPHLANGQTTLVDIDNFNADKLNALLIDYTNQQRLRKRKQKLLYYPQLNAAAKNHALYMADRSYLGHFQKKKSLKTVRDRLKLLGGNAEFVGENVQFISILFELEQSNGNLTYEQLAKLLGDNWKRSRGHYKNMIESVYTGVTHQFAVSNGMLYACQLFTSKPYTP